MKIFQVDVFVYLCGHCASIFKILLCSKKRKLFLRYVPQTVWTGLNHENRGPIREPHRLGGLKNGDLWIGLNSNLTAKTEPNRGSNGSVPATSISRHKYDILLDHPPVWGHRRCSSIPPKYLFGLCCERQPFLYQRSIQSTFQQRLFGIASSLADQKCKVRPTN